MSNLNKPKCSTEQGNVGVCDCALAIEILEGFIPAPRGFKVLAADMVDDATFLETLQDAVLAARSGRIYPVAISGTPTDNSQDPTAETLGNGGIAIVREGFYDITVQAEDNSVYLAQQLRTFNKSRMGVFLYDQNGTVWGIKSGDDLMAIPLELIFTDYKLPTASNIAQVLTRLVWDKATFLSGFGFYELEPADLITLEGLKNIQLKVVSRAGAAITINATILGCGDNLGLEYETEAENVANWTAVNAVTGASLTITSIVYNATTGNFLFTLSTNPTDPVIINLVNPVALKTGGISGYESTGKVQTAS